MDAPGSSPKAIFRQCFPAELLQDIVRVTFRDYEKAKSKCEELFSKEEAHDALPIVRRGFIEQDIRQVTARYDGVAATAELNSANNAYHTEIVADRTILTVSAVDGPEYMPREAKFRQGYAAEYQLHLPFDGHEDPPREPRVYAILIHGPNPRQPSLPGFIHVIFPGPSYPSRMCSPIDLLAEFGDLAQELQSGSVEEIPPPSTGLRRSARRRKSEQEA